MNFIEFKKIIDKKRKEDPFLFASGWDNRLGSDRLGSKNDIIFMENKLGVKLNKKYKEFVLNYKSGDFGFTNIFSVNLDSKWNIFDRNKKIKTTESFIAISDDETGGYYGFKVIDKICTEEIYYLDLDQVGNPIESTDYKDIYEYIILLGFTI